MSKLPKTLAVQPAADRDPLPPRGLNRSQRGEFKRLCRLRRAAGRPVSALERDLLADYLAARTRLDILQETEAEQASGSHFFLRDQLALAAAIDRAAGVVRRLARDLGLIS